MTYTLGSLQFGGRVIMVVGHEHTVELPCGLFVRVTLPLTSVLI